MTRTDMTLDIKGLLSPRCEVVTQEALARMGKGQVLAVVTTDRTVKEKLTEFCRTMGYRLLDIREDARAVNILIQK